MVGGKKYLLCNLRFTRINHLKANKCLESNQDALWKIEILLTFSFKFSCFRKMIPIGKEGISASLWLFKVYYNFFPFFSFLSRTIIISPNSTF